MAIDTPSTSRLEAILGQGTNFKDRYIKSNDELKEIVSELKRRGHRVVLTQGVYDLIHEGHAKYLQLAKSHGDVLIVGVDSDELTKERKGPNRPIVPQNERIEMLLHLRHVDLVILREAHHDIGDLIRNVKPNVLVTSFSTKDFTDDMAKQYSDVCDEVVTLPPQATTSTSARIRDLTIEGAEKLAVEIAQLTQEFINRIRQSV
jgi:rfaE bifunctional protein nucleotidyltransferase chain/domain